jgi:hypothetical protein
MNTLKCGNCRHYDVIRSGKAKKPVHGWCAIKSIYPMAEELGGPVFPPGVRRMASLEAPAKPVIVEGERTISTCQVAVAK